MNTQHPYRLRPYHNPRNIDESEVPKGWRFRYADEMTKKVTGSKYWNPSYGIWKRSFLSGLDKMSTYIVPVK